MKVRVFTALYWAEDLPIDRRVFGPEHVLMMAANLRRVHPEAVLTLLTEPAYDTAELRAVCDVLPVYGRHHRPGNARLLDHYSPAIPWEGWEMRRLAVGLDTVFVDRLDWFVTWDAAPVGLPEDPMEPGVPCAGVATWDREGASLIWAEYERLGDESCDRDGYGSDMPILKAAHERHRWPLLERHPTRAISWMVHVSNRNTHAGASIVYFHGRPKQWEISEADPVRQIWEGRR